MSQSSDRVKDHPVFPALEALDSVISDAEADEKISKHRSAADTVARLRLVRAHVTRCLGSLDPELIPIDALDQIRTHVDGMRTSLANYRSNRDETQLANANKSCDSALSWAGHLPAVPSDGMDVATEAVTAFKENLGREAEQFQKQLEKLKKDSLTLLEQVESTKKQVDKEEARLNTLGSTFEQQFSQATNAQTKQLQALTDNLTKAESERASLFQKTQQDQSKQFTQAIHNYGQDFSKEQSKRSERFTEAEAKRTTAFNEHFDEQKRTFGQLKDTIEVEHQHLLAQLQEQAKVLIHNLENFKTRAQELVHVTANVAMAGGYQRVANQERWFAIVWNVIAAGSMLGLIYFAVKAFGHTQEVTFGWPTFAGRIYVSLTFAVLATYAGQQARKHQQSERRNRRLQLELASIDPYLSALPIDAQNMLKTTLAPRWFGSEDQTVGAKEPEEAPSHGVPILGDLLKQILDVISKRSG